MWYAISNKTLLWDKKKKNIDYKIGKKNYRFKIDNNILCKKGRKWAILVSD